jgi:hypothetical protein
MASKAKEYSLIDPEILGPAAIASLRKLAPQLVAKNPVMFVVEVGSVVTTFIWLRDVNIEREWGIGGWAQRAVGHVRNRGSQPRGFEPIAAAVRWPRSQRPRSRLVLAQTGAA